MTEIVLTKYVRIKSLDRMVDIMKKRALSKVERPSYRELGITYGITAERVRQIEHRGHRMLMRGILKEVGERDGRP